MRVKKRYGSKSVERFFKKFVYFNYFFNVRRSKEIFNFASEFLALRRKSLTTYQNVVLSVFKNEQ
jgi:hypothetical protein